MAALSEAAPVRVVSEAAPARIAVLGAGWWSQGWHLPDLKNHPGAVIAAIVDPNPEPRSAIPPALVSLARLSQTYECPTFPSLEALLASDVEVDGVICCTSHASHSELGAAALRAGKHVLMEKPMTTDVAQAAALARAARDAPQLYFAVNNTASWRPQALRAAEWVRGGRVGAVEHVLVAFHSPLLWLFDDPANTGWTTSTGSMLGNGFAWGQMSHPLAWVFQVTGLEAVACSCTMTRSPNSGADLTNAATFECRGGATISISGAATLPGNAHGDEVVGKHVSLRVFGSEGVLTYDGDDADEASGRLALSRRDGTHDECPGFLFENFVQGATGPESLQAFVAACRGLPHTRAIGADLGAAVVNAIDAMYRSDAQRGARVSVAE